LSSWLSSGNIIWDITLFICLTSEWE
jgi:hypothetical protein